MVTLTLSAQWLLEKPLDGGLGDSEDTITPAGVHCRSDDAMAVIG